MMNSKTTKRALFFSIISLTLCISMLLGTTYAWFTDSVTSTSNIIKSGTLDVSMDWADGTKAIPAPDSSDWNDASTGAIFDYALWEPGYTEVRHIRIANEGTLALKYKLSIIPEGDISDIVDVIDVYYADPAVQVADRAGLTDANKLGTLRSVLEGFTSSAMGELLEGEAHTVTLALKMREEAGNDYQNKSVGSSFAVQLIATQLTYEEDSYDENYDENAAYPQMSVDYKIPDNATETAVVETENVVVEAPAEFINSLDDSIEYVRLVNSAPEFDAASKTVSFDFVELRDQDGNVIDLENNDKPVTVTISVGDAFVAGDAIKVYHDDVLVATATVAADKTVTYEATHFCEVTLVQKTVANYDEIMEAIYYTGENIVLGNDINLGANPVGYFGVDGSFDLNGKKLENASNSPNPIFYVMNGSEVTIKGEGSVVSGKTNAMFAAEGGIINVNGGTYLMGETNNESHIFSQNSANIIINDGEFITTDKEAAILYCINGYIEVNGGFFQNTANPQAALISMGNNSSYANNQKITLRGGTFVNWNPMDSAFAKDWDESKALLVLDEGYKMISETQANGDVWYTVVAE